MSDADELTFTAFQSHIRGRYFQVDLERGIPATFLWLMEEIGELATALSAPIEGRDNENLREEFADVMAWLFTLANLADVEMASAIRAKYLVGGGPPGNK